MKNCLLKHLIIISCVFLVMHVGLIYILIIPTNFNRAPLNVSSLVIAYFIRDINVYIFLSSGCVYFSKDVLFNEDIFPFARPCSLNSESVLHSLQVQSFTRLHTAAFFSVPTPLTPQSSTITSSA